MVNGRCRHPNISGNHHGPGSRIHHHSRGRICGRYREIPYHPHERHALIQIARRLDRDGGAINCARCTTAKISVDALYDRCGGAKSGIATFKTTLSANPNGVSTARSTKAPPGIRPAVGTPIETDEPAASASMPVTVSGP